MSPQLQLLDVPVGVEGRRDKDFYQTEAWMTHGLLKHFPIGGAILEPCAGEGAIVRVLEQHPSVSHVAANDPFRGRWKFQDDARTAEAWSRWRRFDWIVTNPPFDGSERIVPLALEHARIGVAMLLRLTWFEPTEDRAAFLEAHPPLSVLNMPRWNFKERRFGGETDSVTAAWFVWLADDGHRRYGRNPFPNGVVTRAEADRLSVAAKYPERPDMRGPR